MLKQFITGTTLLSTALLSMSAHAIDFGKPFSTPVVITKPGKDNIGKKKNVMVMDIKLGGHEQQMLMSYQPRSNSNRTNSMMAFSDSGRRLPAAINLGMNNVPVLDQGAHGTCATFAVTAAIDAVLGKGDYVSQLCNLELGDYLEEYSYMPSGWWGTFAQNVFDQALRFGVVSKETQRTKSCAGVTEYPRDNWLDSGMPIPVEDYYNLSEKVHEKFYAVHLMDAFERFDEKFSNTDKAEQVLMSVKQALVKGNRIAFGTLLVLSPYCSAGACATFKEANDTWAMTKEIETPPYGMGGHEMVITGYDDKAIAIDQEGKRHQGLLTLRNSWGDDVGDHGNYYMSYDYFKKFVWDAHEVVEIKE